MPGRPSVTLVRLAAICAAGLLVRLPRIVVEGDSMMPTLADGDRIVVVPLPPRTGRLVVIADPRRPDRKLIKRVTTVHESGSVVVVGDNPTRSTDSRTFGAVPAALVLGRPAYRYHPTDNVWLWRS